VDPAEREGGDTLLAAVRDFRRRAIPKLGESADLVADADIDLFEEDAYLAGLIDRTIARGGIGVAAIILDESIDRRLADALRQRPHDPRLEALRDYRVAMRQMAEILGAAAGVPVSAITG
jgi:hypothetical protein